MQHFLLVLCVAVGLFLAGAEASVMGIDLGSDFIKVTSTKKDGSIDIVLNEQTRRKSYNFIGFRGDERFIGDDARNLAARFPANMFAMTSRLAGVSYDSPSRNHFVNGLNIALNLTKNEKRGTIDVQCPSNPEATYSTDELLAMIFGYCRDITEKDAGVRPSEAVVSIPFSNNMWQRAALVQAGNIRGIRVLGALHATTAAALQFGIQNRGFGNESVYMAVLDMGTVGAEVGIFRIGPTAAPKNGGRTKLAVSLGTIETLAILSDESLGGRAFDSCIAEGIQEEFVAKGIPAVLGGSTIAQKKAIFSLMRAANNAREVLSANPHTPVTVEGVAPDRDFSTKLTREQFETRCASLFDKVVSLAQKAFEKANISPADVRNFEMMGGAARMPKVITDLSAFLGRNVDRTMNSDEAVVFGAVYHAAQLSTHIRVKSFALKDAIPEAVSFDIQHADGSFGTRRELFARGHGFFGARRSITLNRTSDFLIRLFVTREGQEEQLFATANVSGVATGFESMSAFNPEIPHANHSTAVRVQIRISDAGVLLVEEAEARVRYAFNKTKRVKRTSNNSETTAEEGAVSADKENETATNASATYDIVHSITMKRKIAPLSVGLRVASPFLMDSDDIAAAKAVIAAIEKVEKAKRAIATAKNDLETYLQFVKYDGVLDNETLRAAGFLSQDVEDKLRAVLTEVAEWLEDGEGSSDSCTVEDFGAKISTVKAAVAEVTGPFEQSLSASTEQNAEAIAEADAPVDTPTAEKPAAAPKKKASGDQKKSKNKNKKKKSDTTDGSEGAKKTSPKKKSKGKKKAERANDEL